MKVVGIIPARMASSRLPGKPLASILGVPMIGHCYFRSKMCKTLDEVYIATCDEEIVEYAEKIGAKAIMTKDTHQRATDRVAEAIKKIEGDRREEIKTVVMIQGDEPMIVPEMIDASVNAINKEDSVNILNICSPIEVKDFNSPNVVKVVLDKDDNVLYFSREPIPSRAKWGKSIPMIKQLGIIIFKKFFLFQYNKMKPAQLEKIESCDMLRVLENGYKIKAHVTDRQTWAVDTQQDLKLVESKMKNDRLVKFYNSS